MENNKRNYFWNTIGTGAISFISLFLMIIVTRINGIENAGVFSFSFSSACIINIFALYCGRTFQVTDDNSEISEQTYIVTRILTSIVGLLISVLFCLLNSYYFEKSIVFIILCAVKSIEAICDLFYGMNQKREKLYIAGKSMFYRTIVSITAFLLIDLITHNLLISCITLLIVTILFMYFYDYYSAKKIMNLKISINKQEIKLLIQRAFYTCCFSLIVMVAINIPKYAIDYFSTSKVQAIYGIISMPATFIMLFGQFILQPSLTSLADSYYKKDKLKFKKIVNRISLCIFGSLIIILPLAYFFGIPVLNLIYGVSLNEYRLLLIIIIVGAAFYAVSQVLLNALITIRCTKEQLYLQLFTLVISVLIAIVFVKFWGLNGSVYSYFTILVLQFIFYYILYKVQLKIKFK